MSTVQQIGSRNGTRVVVAVVHDGKHALIEFVCDCGNRGKTQVGHFARSKTCIKCRKPNLTHGRNGSPEHVCWIEMRKRCENPNVKDYVRYGGRGIHVCERWQFFENFLADMGPRPSTKHSIDRYPNRDGNYEPGNCRWATSTEQNNNRSDNRWIEFRGERHTAAEWSRITGLSQKLISKRILRGDPLDRVFEGGK
jgi:hypothetical protein